MKKTLALALTLGVFIASPANATSHRLHTPRLVKHTMHIKAMKLISAHMHHSYTIKVSK